MSKIQGVIFDMDGLLVDSELMYYRATQKAADRLGIPYDQEYYMRFVGISDEELLENYYRDFAAFPREKIQAFIDGMYEEIFRMFKEEPIPLKAGVRELMTFLNERNIPRVVASSNTKEVVDIIMDKTNLAKNFAGWVTAEDVKEAKPHPEIVEKAVTLLGTKKAETVMLEDSINGIRASHAANVPVIMVPDLIQPSDEAKEKTFAIVDSLFDVPQFF